LKVRLEKELKPIKNPERINSTSPGQSLSSEEAISLNKTITQQAKCRNGQNRHGNYSWVVPCPEPLNKLKSG
jgi:hypothetical protein